MIDLVEILQTSDICIFHNFRPIRQRILGLADKQISLYEQIDKGDINIDDDDEHEYDFDDEGSDDSFRDLSTTYDTDSDDEVNIDIEHSDDQFRLLDGFIFGWDQLKVLEEKLNIQGDFLLKFELLDGMLIVRTVPGMLHETSASYFTTELSNWSTVPGASGNNKYTLHAAGSASMPPFILL